MLEGDAEKIAIICEAVAEGQTIRQVARTLGISPGHALRIINRADDEWQKQYARARDIAADLFESDIIMHAEASSPETAASDRVKIDALKWVAARRAPKRYSDRMVQELANHEDKPLKTDASISVRFIDGNNG